MLSKKQAVASSTAQSEYLALSTAVQEAMWLMKLLTELGISTESMEDNQDAMALVKNPISHARMKHTDI